MPVLIVILIGTLIWMYLTFQTRKDMSDCRWRANRSLDSEAGHYYSCTFCGAEVFCDTAEPPKACLRPKD
ncbi:MAG: hypothetical protein ACPGNV_00855 [Mangrovicoccus sp.]